ncbi:hypothetical protein HJC22_18200 [Corallococcus exiguus]|uniref:hypothetical protein n=1 Tax=Corallococcus exiguus TaxID=83462 RepID=UPI0014723477|nr:hypothetical protein [Corallococcus exiguus]NNC17653.1 hypothetical protein [Corallococcus exiguus]
MTHPTTRPFPLQLSRSERKAGLPSTIQWALAERAYADYSRRFGTSQSLELLAERGGFGVYEMDLFVPGWRKEVGL